MERREHDFMYTLLYQALIRGMQTRLLTCTHMQVFDCTALVMVVPRRH